MRDLLLSFPLTLIGLAVAVYLVVSMLRSVPQATVGVVTVFGRYARVMREGLNIKMPWETVADRLSLQNRALQLVMS